MQNMSPRLVTVGNSRTPTLHKTGLHRGSEKMNNPLATSYIIAKNKVPIRRSVEIELKINVRTCKRTSA